MLDFLQKTLELLSVNDLIETEEHCSEIAIELAE